MKNQGAFRVSDGSVATFTLKLKEAFVTALGAKTETTNVAVRLKLSGGAEGYGEASGSVVMAHQTPRLIAGTLRKMLAGSIGKDAAGFQALAREAWREFGRVPAAAAAFECALTSAVLAQRGIPLWEWFGGSRSELRTDLTLSARPPKATGDSARAAVLRGFRTLKLKVGKGGPKADLARAAAADDAARKLGKRVAFILDGNQRMSVAGALHLAQACLKRGIRVVLLEQPLPYDDLNGMARLTRDCPVPVAADESLRSAADAVRLADKNAASVFNVKLAKTGIQESLDIISVARAAGKKLMIGCMQESALGLEPSVHLACGTGAFSFTDLDSDVLLEDDQPRGGFTRRGAVLRL